MAKKAAKTKRRKPAPRAKLALAQSSHPSPIYKHVPGGGLVRCIWNDSPTTNMIAGPLMRPMCQTGREYIRQASGGSAY